MAESSTNKLLALLSRPKPKPKAVKEEQSYIPEKYNRIVPTVTESKNLSGSPEPASNDNLAAPSQNENSEDQEIESLIKALRTQLTDLQDLINAK